MTEVEMVGWPHQFDGHEFGQAPGVGNGTPLQYSCLGNPMEEEPGRLQPWGREELDMTQQLNKKTIINIHCTESRKYEKYEEEDEDYATQQYFHCTQRFTFHKNELISCILLCNLPIELSSYI